MRKDTRLFVKEQIIRRKISFFFILFVILHPIRAHAGSRRIERNAMRKKTLEDISRLTGFSKTVISRVLNGKAEDYRISQATVEKIMKTCEEEQYKPNFYAQTLRKRSSRTIGLILPHLNYTFFGNVASIIISEAYRHGYMVSVAGTMEDTHLEANILRTMIDRQMDGIIISPCIYTSPALLKEAAAAVPLIQVDRYLTDEGLSYITTENYEGAKLGMRQLIEHGHKRILCIQQGVNFQPTKERVRAVFDMARAHGVEVRLGGDDSTKKSGYVETMITLSSPNPPTAIFTMNTYLMTGVLQALREKGLRAPEDISLISFDDSKLLDYTEPPVTRIAQPVESICMAAVRILMQSLAEKEPVNVRMMMAPELIVRDSIKHLL